MEKPKAPKSYGIWYVAIIALSFVLALATSNLPAGYDIVGRIARAAGNTLSLVAIPAIAFLFTRKKTPKQRFTTYAVVWASFVIAYLVGVFM